MIDFFFNPDPWSIGPIIGGGILTLAVIIVVATLEWAGKLP